MYLTWIILAFPFSLDPFQALRERVKISLGNPVDGNRSDQFSDGSESVPICRLVAVSDVNDKNFADSIRARYIQVWIIGYYSYLQKPKDERVISLRKTVFKTCFVLHSKIIISILSICFSAFISSIEDWGC